VIAYKFLRAGRVGPFSEFRWPEAGEWVRSASGVAACRHGIHACRLEHLPWWLTDELWEIELGGEPTAHDHKLVASSGRLISRIADWTPACAEEFAAACAWRASDRAVQSLRIAHREELATELEMCTTLDGLVACTSELIARAPEARINLAVASDGGRTARAGAAATSAYIAAQAAARIDGRSGYAAERRWQSNWLRDRLALGSERNERNERND
jgi:hypothetical protein